MINPKQIPQSAWLAMRDQMREGIQNEATLIAAALNAWPGMERYSFPENGFGDDYAPALDEIILPLPQEKPDGLRPDRRTNVAERLFGDE